MDLHAWTPEVVTAVSKFAGFAPEAELPWLLYTHVISDQTTGFH
jgi:hypothetical protein